MRQNLKRKLALVLCILMLVPFATSCGYDEDYTGPTLQVYLSDMPTTFDPAYAYLDESSMQILSLIYEGLFSYDEDGKLVNAIADSYRWVKQDAEESEYELEITLKETSWSDGQQVTADNFVYAWRRLLDPGMSSDAACLLYDIKNAREVKSGDVSIFDFGAYAVDTQVIHIEFDHEVDLDQFFANLASPALVPLRDDVVEKNGLADWDTTSAIVVSNGPFYLKSYTIGSQMRLERNRYYLRDVESDALDKYVTPYRLVVNFSSEYVTEVDEKGETVNSIPFDSTYELNDYLWQNDLMHYYSNIPLEYRASYEGKTESTGLKSTATVLFNTENELLSDAKVRRALSLVIDREALAKQLVSVTPAKGLVCDGVLETTAKAGDTFREKGGSLIASTADIDAAKALLKEAGVSGGSFQITVKPTDAVAVATAEYLVEAWKQIGFTVSVAKLYASDGNYKSNGYYVYSDQDKGYDNLIGDCFTDTYKAGNFDAILVDTCQLTTSAFSTLAPYATGFCGSGIDLSQQIGDEYDVAHITGYRSDAYDALIEAAFAEKSNTAVRAEKLHEAEKLLLEDAPVVPLYTYETEYLTKDDVKKLDFSWFGTAIFTEVDDKDYKYVPGEEE